MAPPQQLPIAYLPGASGSASVWRPIAKRLGIRRPPVLCEYPGLGNDAATVGIESLSDLARTVLHDLPARCDLAALSMGAAVALRLASEHPERFRRLVLVAPAGGVDVLGLGGLDWRDSFRRRRPQAPSWFLDDQVDLSDRLGLVTAPTLLIFGDQDLIAPVAVGQHLLARLPSAKLEIVTGATHDLEAEQPDLLASLLEAHLRAAGS
jgi:pimeloyl-ACP methyl ester carboxylesterase